MQQKFQTKKENVDIAVNLYRQLLNYIPLVCTNTSSKAQSSGWSLPSLLLGDQINPSIMLENLFILSPKTANSLHPLCPRIISSILQKQDNSSYEIGNGKMTKSIGNGYMQDQCRLPMHNPWYKRSGNGDKFELISKPEKCFLNRGSYISSCIGFMLKNLLVKKLGTELCNHLTCNHVNLG